ncbi:hypothetical protein FGO68_gene6672 [Halteria grandinella]|uniref:Uncharacterized protein n=1 Tax=Halteria grandinella TaxID=5974 RepID=A0A8J8T4R1_HALGN|nr:hypothetical protein FGO68_gene6672 [Halteria grandinella]
MRIKIISVTLTMMVFPPLKQMGFWGEDCSSKLCLGNTTNYHRWCYYDLRRYHNFLPSAMPQLRVWHKLKEDQHHSKSK